MTRWDSANYRRSYASDGAEQVAVRPSDSADVYTFTRRNGHWFEDSNGEQASAADESAITTGLAFMDKLLGLDQYIRQQRGESFS